MVSGEGEAEAEAGMGGGPGGGGGVGGVLDLLEMVTSSSRTGGTGADGDVDGDGGGDGEGEASVRVKPPHQRAIAAVLRRYTQVRAEGRLLVLDFVTVNEYLWLLRGLAVEMRPLGARGLFYLAAAVSDFFVPRGRMVEHKIQSGEEFQRTQPQRQDRDGDGRGSAEEGGGGGGCGGGGGGGDGGAGGADAPAPPGPTPTPAAHISNSSLLIALDPVPKFLKQLVDAWAPQSMIVSFKLETDPDLLAQKARKALRTYAHHLVIGNLLATRKWEVLFVEAGGGERWVRVPAAAAGEGGEGEPKVEIEGLIVPEVARMHEEVIRRGEGSEG